MAFKPNDLSVLAYANSFTLWHYTTNDKDITENGYFDIAHDMMQTGDLIIANVDTGGAPDTKFHIISGNNGASVAVSLYG